MAALNFYFLFVVLTVAANDTISTLANDTTSTPSPTTSSSLNQSPTILPSSVNVPGNFISSSSIHACSIINMCSNTTVNVTAGNTPTVTVNLTCSVVNVSCFGNGHNATTTAAATTTTTAALSPTSTTPTPATESQQTSTPTPPLSSASLASTTTAVDATSSATATASSPSTSNNSSVSPNTSSSTTPKTKVPPSSNATTATTSAGSSSSGASSSQSNSNELTSSASQSTPTTIVAPTSSSKPSSSDSIVTAAATPSVSQSTTTVSPGETTSSERATHTMSSFVRPSSSTSKPSSNNTAPSNNQSSTVSPTTVQTRVVVSSTSAVVVPPPKIKTVNMKVTFDIPFLDEYRDRNSEPFKKLKKNFTEILEETLRDLEGFAGVEILSFRQGSVVCDFDVIFNGTTTHEGGDVKKTLQEASKDGSLGGYAVKNIEAEGEKKEEKKDDLPLWAIITLILLGALGFVLLITVIILAVLLRRNKESSPLYAVSGEDWTQYESMSMGDYKTRAAEVERGRIRNGDNNLPPIYENHPTSHSNLTYQVPANGE